MAAEHRLMRKFERYIIFATKERKPWIADSWRARLHEYLGGTAHHKELAGWPIISILLVGFLEKSGVKYDARFLE
jgi:hypothetical protein